MKDKQRDRQMIVRYQFLNFIKLKDNLFSQLNKNSIIKALNVLEIIKF